MAMAEPKPKRKRNAADQESQWRAEVEQLSFNEARTALELAMAKLQSSELEVEEMATLYRRAEAYANRCSAVLEGVEQEVIQWDTPSA
ncbi:MAG: exodeoxyribonuclease small subunit [Cyanobacteriota bacterium]|jgi:exodeoxyribonuclease VII small subunit